MDSSSPILRRYFVVSLATLAAVLLYLDRICLAFTERFITEDLGLTSEEAGWLLGVFFWAYALGQVPAGWLGDRFGVRNVLALYILGWSVFTGLIGVAASFPAVLAYRFGCGLAQAGAYPASASLLSKWVPLSQRAFASGMVATGGRIGGFLAPVLTAYLIVAFVPVEQSSLLAPADLLKPTSMCSVLAQPADSVQGHLARSIMSRLPASVAEIMHGTRHKTDATRLSDQQLSILVAGLNEVLQRPDLIDGIELDQLQLAAEARRLLRPVEQLSPSQIERRNRLVLEAAFPEQIRKLYGRGWRPVMVVYGLAGVIVAAVFWLGVRDRPASAASDGSHTAVAYTLPLGRLASSWSLWLSSINQFWTNFGWVFLITWFPRFLVEVHQVPVVERGWMASLPLLVGMTGMLAGGWFTDVLTRRLGLRWGRALPMGLTRFAGALAFAACVLLDSPWGVTIALCVVAFTTDLGVPAAWAFMQDVGGKHVGSVLGWGNMWGNVGAAVSPVVLNWIIGPGYWDAMFLTCAGAFVVSGAAALGINATIPIVPGGRVVTGES